MKINPVQMPLPTSSAPLAPSSVSGGGGSAAQSPVQSSPTQAPAGQFVPRGQLERDRGNLPQGWFNDGGHKGFKPAVITQVAEGYHLAAVDRSDIPPGRR